ncbi:hypothetical protein LFYK43_21310 [Ligilactobacillus salitolerans]|uniref:Uncharacterized protein n=1 Tax=Ligilactobacillus salitolerans TaxID=1808352 RepID=A0A401IVX5_9LACO|nr:hypothetical protein [Ligilactobacillus salitolerans]GBG95672.1 hypothetical protein LFYK43_21310 [Ligilactobacillus salitolerans]
MLVSSSPDFVPNDDRLAVSSADFVPNDDRLAVSSADFVPNDGGLAVSSADFVPNDGPLLLVCLNNNQNTKNFRKISKFADAFLQLIIRNISEKEIKP